MKSIKIKKTLLKALTTMVICFSLIQVGCSNDDNHVQQPPESAILLLEQAYLYGIPLVTMDITRRQSTHSTAPVPGEMQAPLNVFSHLPIFPGSDFTAVVRPNVDTFYSNAWLDLSQGPVTLKLPADNDRYHLLPILDAFTNVITSIGTRTIGNIGGEFLITGPFWQGSVPSGVTQIKSPTTYAWIIGRTEVKSEQDGKDFVYPLIQQYTLSPPSGYKWPALQPDVPVGDPNDIVDQMDITTFFNYLNQLLVLNPPLQADLDFIEKLKPLGVGADLKFELSGFSSLQQQAIKSIPSTVLTRLQNRQNEMPVINGWVTMENTGDYGTDYLHRAYVTRFGLGANLPEDAIYPTGFLDSKQRPFHGDYNYVIHFEKDKLPPANAFWSLTMYNSAGFFVANELDRFALGDRSDMVYNPDGSLDIYIQVEKPEPDKVKNWLPANTGSFNLTLRVYHPKKEMLNKQWQAPVFTRVE
ncbi:DUF1254 domain-containing protein [Myroides sp. LJL119]